jgi:flagellar motor switch protein FliN/FliY
MAEEPAPAGTPEGAPNPVDPSATPATAPVEPVAAAPEAAPAADAPADAAADQAALDALNAVTSAEAATAETPTADSPGGDGAAADPFATAAGDSGGFDQSAIDELLKQANFEDPSALPPEAAAALPETSNFELPNFQQAMQDAQVSSIDLLRDVELNVKIELGRSRMLVEDVLKLGEGSVVELDKLAGDPVDVFVNERLVARGEVLVLNDNFCVRVNEIVAGAKDDML